MIHTIKSLYQLQKIPPTCIFWLTDLNTPLVWRLDLPLTSLSFRFNCTS